MQLAGLIEDILGTDLPVGVRAYDGSSIGPADPPATICIRSPAALQRLVTAPGELGLARAYVAGDIDIEGDIYAALSMRDRLPDLKLSAAQWASVVRMLGAAALRRQPPLPEEVRLRGRRHTKGRDAAAIAHHYDVSNSFYRLVLGPSMTYSCAVWEEPDAGLEAAQDAKHELVCRKLGLQPGLRLLDVGCGWGAMVAHAARHHGVTAVGVTVSKQQVEWAAKQIAEQGLAERVQVRLQDYRDVDDGPYDAISSIGMFEHVGRSQLETYFSRLFTLLAPGGRLLNHGISRPPFRRSLISRPGFFDRFVFPDGELHEIGSVLSVIQEADFEARHVEGLREHYALTLRAWTSNLDAGWDQAVADVGEARARIWRLHLAGSALNFEANRTQVHQVLAVRPDGGRSGLPLRPDFA